MAYKYLALKPEVYQRLKDHGAGDGGVSFNYVVVLALDALDEKNAAIKEAIKNGRR